MFLKRLSIALFVFCALFLALGLWFMKSGNTIGG
jgi:hypothetical protein